MERYLLQFMFVMVVFSGGGLLVNAWLNELSNKKIEIVPPPVIEAETGKLTFDCGCDTMMIAEDPDGVSGGTCVGSDDSRIYTGRYLDTGTKDSAARAFEKELKKALKIVSIAPIFDDEGGEIGKRALLKNDETVKIVKLLKVAEKRSYRPYVVSLIEAPDFRRGLAYEDREKEVSRNIRAASFEGSER